MVDFSDSHNHNVVCLKTRRLATAKRPVLVLNELSESEMHFSSVLHNRNLQLVFWVVLSALTLIITSMVVTDVVL